MTPPVLSIVGYSNSGKTTLMEKLVSGLTERRMRIATIKHSHHQPEMDTPGKDSWRHKQAGAAASLLVGPERMLMVSDVSEALNPQILAARFFSDYDLVLVEGYASIPGPKIEVVRAAHFNALCCTSDELIAIATDIPDLVDGVPIFSLNDKMGIIEHILHWVKMTEPGV